MDLTQIDVDFKQAMRDKNEIVVSSLRNLKSELKNLQIEKQTELTADDVTAVIAKQVKRHKDSIESFKTGGRADLVEHEEKQMEVLQKYLPKQMDESEVREVVKAVVAETSAKQSDFGKVMKEVMNRCKGKTEGNLVSKIVKEILGS